MLNISCASAQLFGRSRKRESSARRRRCGRRGRGRKRGGRGRRRQRSERGGCSLLHFIFFLLQKVGWDKTKLPSKFSTVEPVTILQLLRPCSGPSINLIVVIVRVCWYHVSIYGNPVSCFEGELQVWIWVGRVFLGNIVIHCHHFLRGRRGGREEGRGKGGGGGEGSEAHGIG